MVSSDCLGSVDICALRVAQLLSTGHPQAGAFGYFSTSVQSVKAGQTTDTIQEQIQRDGCNNIVNFVPEVTTAKGASFEVVLTKWERSLIKLLCGGSTFTNSGHVGAYRAPFLSDGQSLPCCVEFWTKAWDGSSQGVTAISTPNGSYHHFVLPFVRCYISPIDANNTPGIFTITGVGNENPQITADGPWNDWPSWIAGGGGFTSAYGEYDDGTIPTGSCGLQTVPTTS